MKLDWILLTVTSFLTTLEVLQTEGRVYCYRRVRRRGKCAGFLRREFYSSPEACCDGRGQGFASSKERLGKNRFRCSPCQSLLPARGRHLPKVYKRPVWPTRNRHRKKKTSAPSTTTTSTTTTTKTTYTTPAKTNSSTRPASRLSTEQYTFPPWPTPARTKGNTVIDYPPPKDDDGNVIVWEEWSPCSVSCGAGWRSRARVCEDCDHNDYENVQSHPCMDNFYCPVDGNWGPWFPWDACSSTCGVGTRKRERKCNYPPPAYGGAYCENEAVAAKQCSNKPCPVNGEWGSWSEYSPCSQSCGQGVTRRSRACDNPYPSNGGSYCQGREQMTRKCEAVKCSVEGGWSLWNAWTACSSSCGQGLKERTRDCNSPSPNYGGKDCQGRNSDVAECYGGRPCPVDGGWTEWTNYGYCRAPRCGRGYQIRSRSCSRPRPVHGGKPCKGQRYERVACLNDKDCPRGGSWCAWGPWNECSSTCHEDGPVQGRQRECACPGPVNGGEDCQGQSFELKECTNVPYCSTTNLVPSSTAVEEATFPNVDQRKNEDKVPKTNDSPKEEETRFNSDTTTSTAKYDVIVIDKENEKEGGKRKEEVEEASTVPDEDRGETTSSTQ